eukprot:CAMPEP_0184663200 /NCGR_PEP_ID=MMETSP0308-20130426/47021_1 /TAXON_ID=38269 /ORGANISM="Gloeochaete witrockiana, Strain SAG 46.84" /LENGTH=201 /DNA_ID=CAMNT_0027105765 /DNA_START=68 /DNA_END=673 /DNA_ORIENTATION=-
MEIEALQAIFMDDFTMLENEPPRFLVTVVGEDGNTACSLIFTYTETYPEEVPHLYVKSVKNVSEDQCTRLQEFLKTEATSILGMAMVHTLVQFARDWLAQHIGSEADARAKALEEERKQVSKFEQREEFKGTPVTLENFREWKAKFDAELEVERLKKAALEDVDKKKRLSGRQLFEGDKTLSVSDEQFMDEEDLFDEELFS